MLPHMFVKFIEMHRLEYILSNIFVITHKLGRFYVFQLVPTQYQISKHTFYK